MRQMARSFVLFPLLLTMVACSRDASAPAAEATPPDAASAPADPALETPPSMPAPVESATEAASGQPAFAGKVWKVVASEGVQAGTTYAFLADGTLVIEAPAGNPPGYGKWTYADGKLTIEEEGIAYPTDILHSDANRLELRSHNPGGTLDIKLEAAPDAALPSPP